MSTARTSSRPQPREGLDRCALRAQLRGDPMLGTAFPAARLLLVEQPGPWGHAGLADSRFDRSVARQLERAAGRDGYRLEAIRRPGRTPPGAARTWALVDTRPGHVAVRRGTFDADADLLDLALDAGPDGPGTAGDPDEPFYLVCTHGRHDACCALRGRPVAAALAEVRPGRVWECSHLGGDRFAANVLVLPSGLLYGRLLPFAAGGFAAAADAGEVVAPLLRGRVGLAPVAQSALAFVHQELGLRYDHEARVTSATPIRDGRASVTVATTRGTVVVDVAVEVVPAPGLTCGNPGPNRFLRYRPVAFESLGDSPA